MDDRTRIEHLVDYWTPILLRLCVDAGIIEAFGREERTVDDVASDTGTHAATLGRVVRALAANGIFEAVPNGRHRLTPLGQRLLRESTPSLAGLASFKPWEIHAWAEVAHTLCTGEAAFPQHYGHGFWDHLASQPALAATFNEQMQRRTASLLAQGLNRYPWPESGVIVDLGGGIGLLLERLLTLRPELRGILFDLPHVVETADAIRRNPEIAARVEVVGGDLFTDDLPRGGDIYVLSSVLHDWDDESACAILRRCREAMAPRSVLVLFESALPEGPNWDLGKLVDLHMLVLFGAKERTEAEWRDLLVRSGFELQQVLPTGGLSWIEARPKASAK